MTSIDHTEVCGIKYDLQKLGAEYVITTPFERASEIRGTIQSGSDDDAIKAFHTWAMYQFREFPVRDQSF